MSVHVQKFVTVSDRYVESLTVAQLLKNFLAFWDFGAAGFSLRLSGFAPRAVHVDFVMDRVALGRVLLRVLLFYPVIILCLLHVHICSIW
jgi:hypothetical protein